MKNKGIHYAWVILFSACIIMGVAVGIVGQSAGIFFAPVSKELGVGRGPLATYMMIQAIVTMVTLPFAGRMLPKLNFKVVQTLTALVLMTAFMAMSQYYSLLGWYFSGAISGVALAFTGYLAIPIMLGNWFKKKIGLAIGLAMAFTGVGGAAFNIIGSNLIKNYGWRTGYWGLGLIGLVLILPCTIFLVRFRPSEKGMLAYGEDELVNGENTAQKQTADVLKGVSAAIALKTPSFWLIFLTAGLLSFNGIFTQHIPAYVLSLGFSVDDGAKIISIILIVSIIAKIALGVLNDKIGIIKASTIAITVVVAGLAVLLLSGQSMALLITGAVLFGLGLAASAIEPPLLVRQVFGSREYSAIFAYVMMALNLMVGVGVSAFGFMYDFLGSYGPAIMLVIGLYIFILVAIIASVTMGKKLIQD